MLDLFIIRHKLMYQARREQEMLTKEWDLNPMFSWLLMTMHVGYQ